VYGSICRDKREEALLDIPPPDRKRVKFELSPVLLVAKVVTGRVYPANRWLQARGVTRTSSDAVGRANVPGYDSHFSLVKQGGGDVFEPIQSLEEFDKGVVVTELVAFDAGQVLPVALVRPSVKPSRDLLFK
jgi:hypothetical protein